MILMFWRLDRKCVKKTVSYTTSSGSPCRWLYGVHGAYGLSVQVQVRDWSTAVMRLMRRKLKKINLHASVRLLLAVMFWL